MRRLLLAPPQNARHPPPSPLASPALVQAARAAIVATPRPSLAAPLPAHLRTGIESLSGVAMGDARVHRNSPIPPLLHAKAFARGTDIHLEPGAEPHLAHEAWHVAQQKQLRVAATGAIAGQALNDSPALEREATQMGARAQRMPHARAEVPPYKMHEVSPARPPLIQRTIRIDSKSVLPPDHQLFLDQLRDIILANGGAWSLDHALTVTNWLQQRDQYISTPSLDMFAHDLLTHGDQSANWVHSKLHLITPVSLQDAHLTRKRQRASSLLKPSTMQITKRVPGMANLKDEQLARLSPLGGEENEHWLRRSDGTLATAKRRDLKKRDEVRIVAAGDKNDPSYLVWHKDRQLAHRYKGDKSKSHKRTYGSKQQREGYAYKGSGLVDGHSIQVQDDQLLLGPFQADVPYWTTKVQKTGGGEVEYPDHIYLPVDETDKRWAETMPYNFYWENQEQGKHLRQKGIEAPALRDQTSFLHFSEYTGDTFHPNAGKAKDHIYHVPSTIHYLVSDTSGATTHYRADNRPIADYSKLDQFDSTTMTYPSVPSGKPSHNQNTSLGGKSVQEHLAKLKDPSPFPSATVLYPEKHGFSFLPDWRAEIDGYQSPPPSPYFDRSGIEETDEVVPGDRSELASFGYGGLLVKKAAHDKATAKTTLTKLGIKSADKADLQSDGSQLKSLLATPSLTPFFIPPPTTEYMPNATQLSMLAGAGLHLHWTVPNGFCIFASLATVTGIPGTTIQNRLITALQNDPAIQAWVTGYSAGAHDAAEMIFTVGNIYARWGDDASDLILQLAAQVLKIVITVINPNGTESVIHPNGTITASGGGANLLVRVDHPMEHYHGTTK